jgi:Fe-S cluster assembly protein SufD
MASAPVPAAAAAPDFGWGEFASARSAAEPRWLADRREAAIARFRETGLPSVRDEDWRQTPVGPIARTTFGLAPAVDRIPEAALARLGFDGAFAGRQVVLVNGRFVPGLSSLEKADGVRVESLAAVLARDPAALEGRLGAALRDANPFATLNTAFLADGAVVTIAPGAAVAAPVHVLHYSSPGGAPAASHPRVLVVAGRASQSTLVESYGGEGTYLTNAVTEAILEDGAHLDHYTLQRESAEAFHVATLAVAQGRDARFSSCSVLVGGSLARQDVQQAFAAEGGECALAGLFLASDSQVIDVHTRVDHAVPHCTSRQVYKGIVDGRARGVFVGRVFVAKDAQKTDAQQTNKNLLLSRQALVHSVPQLEILADDVKCKHGSTTGQIDPSALFYLRSRGIGEDTARSLLTYAFASDIVSRIRVEPVRSGLSRYLRDRLPQAAGIEEAVV